jgi:small subunit ribosomal protein S11
VEQRGRCGFKGSRKSTAYAGTVVSQEACKVAVGCGMHEVEILGAGSRLRPRIRHPRRAGGGPGDLGIKDITPVPHNGCRARKRRRV